MDSHGLCRLSLASTNLCEELFTGISGGPQRRTLEVRPVIVERRSPAPLLATHC
jgi:hypothetical protein